MYILISVRLAAFCQTLQLPRLTLLLTYHAIALQVWPEDEFPLRPVGTMTVNKNISNFHNENEQIAFNPANIVPGERMCLWIPGRGRCNQHRHWSVVGIKQKPRLALWCEYILAKLLPRAKLLLGQGSTVADCNAQCRQHHAAFDERVQCIHVKVIHSSAC